MKRRGLLGLVLLAAICQSALPAWADGLVRDGVGPISTGRGGTNQGFADNAAIILDNPGAMVNVAGSGLAEFGADTVITDVHYSNPLNNVSSKIRPLPMPVLGYIRKSKTTGGSLDLRLPSFRRIASVIRTAARQYGTTSIARTSRYEY